VAFSLSFFKLFINSNTTRTKNKITHLVKKFFVKFKEKINFFNFKFSKKNGNPLEWQKSLDEKIILNLSKSRLPTLKQIKLLPAVLNKKEKGLIKIFSSVVIFCLIILGINFYFQNTTLIPKKGGSYIEGLVGVPKYINPLLAQYNDVDQDVSMLLFNGLMKINNQGLTEVDLASEYQISEDKKNYTFKLKDDVFWHDGEKLTADDLVFTFNSLMDPDWQSLWRSYFNDVTIERIDDLTVRFSLKEPSSVLLENLTFGIIPKHLWQNIPAFNATMAELNKKPIGTGPFRFENLTKDKNGNIRTILLKRNNQYFAKPPYLDEVTFKFYGDFETATEALKNNNIQGLGLLPKEYAPRLEKNNNLVYYNLSLPQYTAIFFNTQTNEFLKSKNVRQALAYAIDKQQILKEAVDQKGQIINGPVLPGFVGYNPNLKKYTFDQAKAVQLLEADGWQAILNPDNEQIIRKKGDKILQIKLTTVDKVEYVKAAEIIQKNWESIGVQTDLDIIAKSNIMKEVIEPRNYQALIFGEIIKNDPYPFWHSTQTQSPGTNLVIWFNREVDKFLEEGRAATDLKVKDEKYKNFQNILAEECPVIFLYNPIHLYPVDKKIKGIETLRINSPADRFRDITNWYIKTHRTWKK